jgi:hypothetical protein
MAKDTFSDTANKVLMYGDPLVAEMTSDSGADIYPGCAVDQTAATTVGLGAVDSVISMGICSDEGRLAIDSAVAEGGIVNIYLWGSSAMVNGYLDAGGNGALTAGSKLISGDTTAGTMQIAGDLSAVDIRTCNGRLGEYITQDGTDNIVCKIILSI